MEKIAVEQTLCMGACYFGCGVGVVGGILGIANTVMSVVGYWYSNLMDSSLGIGMVNMAIPCTTFGIPLKVLLQYPLLTVSYWESNHGNTFMSTIAKPWETPLGVNVLIFDAS